MGRMIMLAVLALFWSCSLHEQPERGPEPQVSGDPVSETKPPEPAAADAVSRDAPEMAESTTTENERPRPDDIRALQARLRRAGFDPGPIDGMFGAKTKTALTQLDAVCADLADLLVSPAADSLRTMHKQPRRFGTGAMPSSANLPTEAVRVLQVRLKEAGFDPGALDGIAGPKTKAAFARLQSGCGP